MSQSLPITTQAAPPPTHARPLPPGRYKRNSVNLSRPNSALQSHSEASSVLEEASSEIPRRGQDGLMGGLRERTEEELKRAGREALETALKEEWEIRDLLMTTVDGLECTQRALEGEQKELMVALSTSQARTEEAFHEQARLEADLEARDEVLDRLRSRVGEAERQAREAQRRYIEQEKSFEVERQAFQAQEQHLHSRLLRLQNVSTHSQPQQPERSAQISELEDEIESLRMSHTTLQSQIKSLTTDLNDTRRENEVLREENQGWELLMREQTLSGKLREGSGLLSREIGAIDNDDEVKAGQEGSRKELEDLDESIEMEELTSDLEAQTPILDEHGGEIAFDLDSIDERRRRNTLETPKRAGRRRPKGESLGDIPVTGSGLDLAAELGRAETNLDGSEMRVLGKGDEGEALRAEVKNLREANKALTLYCSKIIDRIIAQEGFEHILSVDYKTRRLNSRSVSGDKGRGAPVRGSLQEVATAMMESQGEAAASNKNVTKPPMLSRALSSGSKPTTVAGKPEETKPEKRARRGFSLDFRNFPGFGGTSLLSPEPPKPALKPLTLVNRSSPIVPPPRPVQARKLDPHDEDEEDRRERHRMEAALKLMGISKEPETRTSGPDEDSKTNEFSHSKSSWTAGFFKKAPAKDAVSQPTETTSSSPDRREGTPLSRLSTAIGLNPSPLSPVLDSLDPQRLEGKVIDHDLASEALRAFDAREKEIADRLSKGGKGEGYTSPSPPSLGRRTSSRRDSGMSGTSGRRQRSVIKSESSSTLWSMGESSRPPSGEGQL